MTTIVHDWFLSEGGAERVVRELLLLFPEGKLAAAFGAREEYFGRKVDYSLVNRLYPLAKKLQLQRPAACAGLSLVSLSDEHELVVSDGHTASLWSSVPLGTPWVHYCHTPSRFLWRPDLLEPDLVAGAIWSALRPAMRRSDRRRAQQPQVIVSNSQTTAARVREFYHRDSIVVHPPVDTEFFCPGSESLAEGYFLIVGRLERYRRYQEVMKAAEALKVPLLVVGAGGGESELKKEYASRCVSFLGRVDDDDLRDLYGGAEAVVIPNEEDFCMVAVEAMACGTPVVGLNRGGVSETVEDGLTGVLFKESNSGEICGAMQECMRLTWDRQGIRSTALKYSRQAFRSHMSEVFAQVR